MRLRSFCAMRPPGSPREGDLGRLNIPAAGERPPRARPWRRGSPGPVPNPAVKPAVAESTAEEVRGRLGSRARGGRSSIARGPPRAGARKAPDASRARGLSAFRGPARARGLLAHCGGGPRRGGRWRRRARALGFARDAHGLSRILGGCGRCRGNSDPGRESRGRTGSDAPARPGAKRVGGDASASASPPTVAGAMRVRGPCIPADADAVGSPLRFLVFAVTLLDLS